MAPQNAAFDIQSKMANCVFLKNDIIKFPYIIFESFRSGPEITDYSCIKGDCWIGSYLRHVPYTKIDPQRLSYMIEMVFERGYATEIVLFYLFIL